MPKRRTITSAAFLVGTTAVVGWEIYASLDPDPETLPWTQFLVQYVPAPVTYAAMAILIAWLPPHFVGAYSKGVCLRCPTPTCPTCPHRTRRASR